MSLYDIYNVNEYPGDGNETMIVRHGFERRILTFKSLLQDLKFLTLSFPQIVLLLRDEKITRQSVEKIMTVVSAVNGCTYCSWFHARTAALSGISKEEVKSMLNLQFEADASDFELLGLLYAQHYAETNRNPDKEMTEKLFEFYGDKLASRIILVIRMIFFGNLIGNTFDAFLSRLKGNKAQNSNAVFEFFFFMANAPFMLPLTPFMKKYEK
jgi:AhpD family alkylhydroperoxidase